MSTQAFTERFNKTLFAFFKQIIAIYPDVKEFKSLRAQLRMALTANNSLAITHFHQQLVLKYKQQILKQDESFFLDFDLSGTVLADLNHLKNVYIGSSDSTKQAIWKYVKVLTLLSSKVMS